VRRLARRRFGRAGSTACFRRSATRQAASSEDGVEPPHGKSKLDRPAFARGLVGGEDDAQAVERALPMYGKIEVFLDRPQEKRLFAATEFVVIGFIGERDDLIRGDEFALGVAFRAMHAK
jgi:hypothetical protein